jgi:hypothetical protein
MALQIKIETADFERALKNWGPLTERQTVKVLDETENLTIAALQNKTPVLSGRARASWQKVRFSALERGIVSFLVYMRRLEVGRKKRRIRSGQKIPPGGYRMVRDTQKQIPAIINYAAQKVASGNL